eukprot:1816334-Rhodomonas_salina.3
MHGPVRSFRNGSFAVTSPCLNPRLNGPRIASACRPPPLHVSARSERRERTRRAGARQHESHGEDAREGEGGRGRGRELSLIHI